MEILLIWILCGILSWGIALGDTMVAFEQNLSVKGLITGKNARQTVKGMLIGIFIARLILGLAGLVQLCVYKILMKTPFNIVWYPPSDFWTKYFKDYEQP